MFRTKCNRGMEGILTIKWKRGGTPFDMHLVFHLEKGLAMTLGFLKVHRREGGDTSHPI